MASELRGVAGLQLWTIGHSNHPFKRFVEVLSGNDIALLVDVRRFPGSRTFPHFGREYLERELPPLGINYRWMEALGGRRATKKGECCSPNEGWRNKSFRNYADYMMTPEFHRAFDELASLAAAARTAIMCSESVYWRCHRRLVSDYAVVAGLEVLHIFPAGQTKPHTLTDGAVVERADPIRITYPEPAAESEAG